MSLQNTNLSGECDVNGRVSEIRRLSNSKISKVWKGIKYNKTKQENTVIRVRVSVPISQEPGR